MGLSYIVEPTTNKTFFTYFSEFDKLWKTSFILINVILGVLFGVALGGNLLVISFFVRFKAIRQVTNLFITNLAVSDLIFSLMIPLVMTTRVTEDWIFGEVLCHLLTTIEFISAIVSVWTMVLISADRYRAVVNLRLRKATLKDTTIRIAFVWIGAILFSSPIAIFFRTINSTIKEGPEDVIRNVTFCSLDFPGPDYLPLIYSAINIVVVFIIPLAIITRNYRAIMKKFCSSLQRMRDHMESTPGRSNRTSMRASAHVRREARVMRMLIAMVTLFVLMWGPVTIFLVALTADYSNHYIESYHLIIMIGITYTDAALNPVLYGILNEQYRSRFGELFGLSCCKVCDTLVRDEVPSAAVARASLRQVIRTLSGREFQDRRYENGDGCCDNVIDQICEETPS